MNELLPNRGSTVGSPQHIRRTQVYPPGGRWNVEAGVLQDGGHRMRSRAESDETGDHTGSHPPPLTHSACPGSTPARLCICLPSVRYIVEGVQSELAESTLGIQGRMHALVVKIQNYR